MKRLIVLAALALVTCSPLPAQQEQSPSEPMVPLRICEEELTKLEQQSIEQVTKLEAAFEERLRLACEDAAADAVRPVLVRLAGAEAEVAVWRRTAARASIVSAVVAGLLGVFLGWIIHSG